MTALRPIDLGPRTCLQILLIKLMHGTEDEQRKALKMLYDGPSKWDNPQKELDL
jgi:hypothetical protein